MGLLGSARCLILDDVNVMILSSCQLKERWMQRRQRRGSTEQVEMDSTGLIRQESERRRAKLVQSSNSIQ